MNHPLFYPKRILKISILHSLSSERLAGTARWVSFLVMFFLVTVLQAQSDKKLRFSLAASPSAHWMKSDYSKVDRDGLRMGISFGLQADYFFLDNYALSTGLLINNNGGKLRYLDSDVPFSVDDSLIFFNTQSSVDPVTVTYKLQYVEIPMLLKLRTNEMSGKTFYGLFGLSAQMNIQAKGKANQLSIEDASFRDEVNFLNLGYQIGGGAEFSLGENLRLISGLSYFNGFTDITSNTAGRKDDKTTLRSVILHLGVLF